MQSSVPGSTKPTLGQSVFVLLFDSVSFAIYFAVSYLIAAQFFRIHWSLGLIYLIPLVWGFFLFMVSPLAEDGQTPGQRASNILVYRKDGKEYVKDGSTGGIGYLRSVLVWIITRGIVPALALWVLYTNFTYTNLVLVLLIYVASLVAFAILEDSLFGLTKSAYARETELRTRVRGYFEKHRIARSQLPAHAALIPFVLLVGGIIVGVYGAAYFQQDSRAGLAGVLIGLISVFLSQALLSVRKWARWFGIVFLLLAAVVTFMYNFSPLQMYLTAILAVIFALDLLLDPTVVNAFRS